MKYVLDANAISDILRKDEAVVARYVSAIRQDAQFLVCPVSLYEVYRGLLHKRATRQLAILREMSESLGYEDLSREDWNEAASRWAELRRQGQQIADADLLIGVFAARRGALVVTNNVRDFSPLGIPVENWRV